MLQLVMLAVSEEENNERKMIHSGEENSAGRSDYLKLQGELGEHEIETVCSDG